MKVPGWLWQSLGFCVIMGGLLYTQILVIEVKYQNRDKGCVPDGPRCCTEEKKEISPFVKYKEGPKIHIPPALKNLKPGDPIPEDLKIGVPLPLKEEAAYIESGTMTIGAVPRETPQEEHDQFEQKLKEDRRVIKRLPYVVPAPAVDPQRVRPMPDVENEEPPRARISGSS